MPQSAEPVGELSQARHQGAGGPCRADRVAPGVSSAGCRGSGRARLRTRRGSSRGPGRAPGRPTGLRNHHRRPALRSRVRSGRSTPWARRPVTATIMPRMSWSIGVSHSCAMSGSVAAADPMTLCTSAVRAVVSCRCAAKIRALARASAAAVFGGWSTPRDDVLAAIGAAHWDRRSSSRGRSPRPTACRVWPVLRIGWLPASSRSRPPRRSRGRP